jgi:hypothetical protein
MTVEVTRSNAVRFQHSQPQQHAGCTGPDRHEATDRHGDLQRPLFGPACDVGQFGSRTEVTT